MVTLIEKKSSNKYSLKWSQNGSTSCLAEPNFFPGRTTFILETDNKIWPERE